MASNWVAGQGQCRAQSPRGGRHNVERALTAGANRAGRRAPQMALQSGQTYSQNDKAQRYQDYRKMLAHRFPLRLQTGLSAVPKPVRHQLQYFAVRGRCVMIWTD